MLQHFLNVLRSRRWQTFARYFALIALCLLCLKALADGTDLLQGTDANAWSTLTGTGKKYIFLTEGIVAIAAYITTRKLIVFGGFIVISVVINILLHLAGQS